LTRGARSRAPSCWRASGYESDEVERVVGYVFECETGREGVSWMCSGWATLGIVVGIATRVEEGRQGIMRTRVVSTRAVKR
jgi:hypothetical protein